MSKLFPTEPIEVEVKDQRVAVLVTADEKKAVDDEADRLGMTTADFTRMCWGRYFKSQEKKR